jgi:RHS repeat-associated protein
MGRLGESRPRAREERHSYDVDGRRVLDDAPASMRFVAFVEDSVSVDGGLYTETRIEIRAFGERVAYKRSGDDFRTAGGLGAAPWGVPPAALGGLAGLGLLALLTRLAQQGALVLVIQRPGYAGVAAVLVVVLVLGPLPGVPAARAGGGGDASFYWELTDPLGTGMVMLDETGARRVHRTYSPFGVEHASAGTASWLPRHYAGHLEDGDSGLVYMQARWMDPQTGTFLSVDPVVADAADPQAFNAYAYARNNPLSFVDPTGEFCIPIPIFGGSVCTGYEGGYFPGPSWVEGAGYADPGPPAAPISSIGNPVAGGMNLGGDGAPQSQSPAQRIFEAGLTTTGVLIFDDATVVGVVDNVLIPFVAAGTIVAGTIVVGVALVRGIQALQQGAHDPGMPTKADGHEPPKNWDGKKVKNPNGPGAGYPDRRGNVWVPTGPGPGAHGGPHWDVEHPDGSHTNVYPGGRTQP